MQIVMTVKNGLDGKILFNGEITATGVVTVAYRDDNGVDKELEKVEILDNLVEYFKLSVNIDDLLYSDEIKQHLKELDELDR